MNDADPVEWHWASGGGLPAREAFHVETIIDPFTLEEVVGMVRHPGLPFIVQDVKGDSLEDHCRSIGVAYLDALQTALTFPPLQWIHPDIREALGKTRARDQCSFGWLHVTPDTAGENRRPLGTFWAKRDNGEADVLVSPHLLVLLAGSVDTAHQLQGGSDMGLRIVIHVLDGEVRIYGVTLAGLTNRRALDVVPELRRGDRINFDLVSDARKAISLGLDRADAVWVANIEKTSRPDTPIGQLIATGYALRWPEIVEGKVKRPARALTYDFRVELAVDPVSRTVRLVQIHRDLLIGAGARTLDCFVQDAASKDMPSSHHPDEELPASMAQRRSTQSDEALDQFRDGVDAELARGKELKFIDSGVDFFETRATSARSTARLGGCTVAATGGVVTAGDAAATTPPVRSDQQASNDAHLRAAELFARMRAYGIAPQTYFRFASLPLVQRARPAMRWAPDGDLPNAEVRPFLGDPDGTGPRPKPSDALQLLVNYGSADPMHRRKLPFAKGVGKADAEPGRVKAQYLSVASDPRWAWHEFGHVLNFASTGELEFPFAHSAGDALAAIAADPISRLATWDDPDARIRHVTYPWIEVPGRSHGRSAVRGYGWCGCRNLPRLNFTASLERYHHTYFGEQIMSSSLFRLYRSLGGDTRAPGGTQEDDDEKVRLSASDYCIYLIMRGISLLGPDTLAPARTPDQFVSALVDADLGTGAWDVAAAWPFNREGRTVNRRGGRVHKVIRWAFEQQGLYGTDNPRKTAEGPGLPPRVDVYIADCRPDDGTPGDGGYAPVPLRCSDDELWHAHPTWLKCDSGQLTVWVANRGSVKAAGTRLRVWWTSSDAEAKTVKWSVVSVPVSPQSIPCGDRVDFKLPLPAKAQAQAATGKLLVLVSADAPADPSNLACDAPPPESWPELLELVAHDNNLALARLKKRPRTA